MGFAVREVNFIVELMIFVINANHLEDIHVGRSGSYETIYAGVALQQVIYQQWVGSGDVTMHGIVVYTIAVSVIIKVVGDSH